MLKLVLRIVLLHSYIGYSSSISASYIPQNVSRRPHMYITISNISHPILLFADLILSGKCLTMTSRYHTDGRRNFILKKLFVLIKSAIYVSQHNNTTIKSTRYKRYFPRVWRSHGRGYDTPVLQLLYCHYSLYTTQSVNVKIRYGTSGRYRRFLISRVLLPHVDVAACSMTSLADMWSARAWIEHHRNLGVGRFTIFVNDIIPQIFDSSGSSNNNSTNNKDNDKSTSAFDTTVRDSLAYLDAQSDVQLVEWPYPFKDPNSTRDRVKAPMHYARPLEWNSCNEREAYGAKVTLFNDMDEFVVSKFTLLDIVRSRPEQCRAVQIGHIWVKVKCPCLSENCERPFQNLTRLLACNMWRQNTFSMDRKRRTKMIVRTERGDVHDVLNHDLGNSVPLECAVDAQLAAMVHVINLRPHVKHASAGTFHDLHDLLEDTNIPVDVVDMFSNIKNHSSNPIFGVSRRSRAEVKLARPLYVSLTTSPKRIAYLPATLSRLDLSSYNARFVLNLPKFYGPSEALYPKTALKALQAHPDVVMNFIDSDWGPYSKLLPTFDFITAEDAIIISIDDDTHYPRRFLGILIEALRVTNFSSVVGLCGVNVTSWGLDSACEAAGTICAPFDVQSPYPAPPLEGLNILLPIGMRKLTPVHVLKGFTGVAYPRSLITAAMLDDVHSWRTLVALEADQLAGLPMDSCLQSDDLVISAVLHKHNIGRYRISLTNDCREGLAQYEFGFGEDALMMQSGGHFAKYFACARAISHSLRPPDKIPRDSPVASTWPRRSFTNCRKPMLSNPSSQLSKLQIKIRWRKGWYTRKRSPSRACWSQNDSFTTLSVSEQWRCSFPKALPTLSDQVGMTSNGIAIHPMSYAFQLHRTPTSLRPLERNWSVIWPVQATSRHDTNRGYTFSTETAYYNEYGTSLFAYTYRKGGWDSMRHYEILCNGGIPYFIDLEKLPSLTMTTFPRTLVQSVMHVPGVGELGISNHTLLDMSCLGDVRKALMEYCRVNLSTIALARRFLADINASNAKKILMVNGRNQWDYLTDSLFHGLRSLLGSGFVDVKKRHFMYRGGKVAARREGFHEYGKGFSYAWSIPDDPTINREARYIRERIRRRDFDLIVIGQLHQPMPTKKDWTTSQDITEQLFWSDIVRAYPRRSIACIDGLDRHSRRQRKYLLSAAAHCTLFVREIDEYLLYGGRIEDSWKSTGSAHADAIFKALNRSNQSGSTHANS